MIEITTNSSARVKPRFLEGVMSRPFSPLAPAWRSPDGMEAEPATGPADGPRPPHAPSRIVCPETVVQAESLPDGHPGCATDLDRLILHRVDQRLHGGPVLELAESRRRWLVPRASWR